MPPQKQKAVKVQSSSNISFTILFLLLPLALLLIESHTESALRLDFVQNTPFLERVDASLNPFISQESIA